MPLPETLGWAPESGSKYDLKPRRDVKTLFLGIFYPDFYTAHITSKTCAACDCAEVRQIGNEIIYGEFFTGG